MWNDINECLYNFGYLQQCIPYATSPRVASNLGDPTEGVSFSKSTRTGWTFITLKISRPLPTFTKACNRGEDSLCSNYGKCTDVCPCTSLTLYSQPTCSKFSTLFTLCRLVSDTDYLLAQLVHSVTMSKLCFLSRLWNNLLNTHLDKGHQIAWILTPPSLQGRISCTLGSHETRSGISTVSADQR